MPQVLRVTPEAFISTINLCYLILRLAFESRIKDQSSCFENILWYSTSSLTLWGTSWTMLHVIFDAWHTTLWATPHLNAIWHSVSSVFSERTLIWQLLRGDKSLFLPMATKPKKNRNNADNDYFVQEVDSLVSDTSFDWFLSTWLLGKFFLSNGKQL
jgi:hypothetical protein